jgi:hypothetical protein
MVLKIIMMDAAVVEGQIHVDVTDQASVIRQTPIVLNANSLI